jgi:hypothetical protein
MTKMGKTLVLGAVALLPVLHSQAQKKTARHKADSVATGKNSAVPEVIAQHSGYGAVTVVYNVGGLPPGQHCMVLDLCREDTNKNRIADSTEITDRLLVLQDSTLDFNMQIHMDRVPANVMTGLNVHCAIGSYKNDCAMTPDSSMKNKTALNLFQEDATALLDQLAQQVAKEKTILNVFPLLVADPSLRGITDYMTHYQQAVTRPDRSVLPH